MAAAPAGRPAANAAYILLAEFDIEKGSNVSYQYPEPTGTEVKYARHCFRAGDRVTAIN